MDDTRFGRHFGGGQLTRQISSSHVVPSSMSGYTDFFRMSSSKVEGWLETKIGRAERWERKWVVFDDGVLYFSTQREAAREDNDIVTQIPMDRVISLRTDDQYGDSTIQIVTREHKLYMRAVSKDEMFRWLFCFQLSVALVLSKLLASSSKLVPSKMSSGLGTINQLGDYPYQMQAAVPIAKEWAKSSSGLGGVVRDGDRVFSVDGDTDGSSSDVSALNTALGLGLGVNRLEEEKMWLGELGHGHGKHNSLAKRRITFTDGGGVSQSLIPSKSISMFLCDESDADYDRSPNNGSGSRTATPANPVPVPEPARRTVWDRSYAERSVVDLTRMDLQDEVSLPLNDGMGLSTRSKIMSSSISMSVAKSPMIPIVEMNSRSLFDPKFAGSYNDNMGRERVMVGLSLSPPETERGRSASEVSRNSDQSNSIQPDYDDDEHSPESDGDMMFDFDDLDIQGGPGKQPNGNGKKSRGNRSRGFSSLSNSSCNTQGGDSVKVRRPSSRQQQQGESSGLRWSCGSCSKLGPRTSNEDRLVAIPNIYEAVAAAKCKAGLADTSISISGALNSHYLNNNSSSGSHAAMSGNVLAAGIGVPIPIENEHTQRQVERQGYFAVYDGHCGAQAAMHLQETLHLSIFNHPLYHTDLQTAIIESCVNTDRAFLAESRERKQYSGTTALGAIVRGSELVVFNIGDCHAVLSCNGVAIDMSDPHKPNRPDEAARILAAKGWITEEKELYMARLHRMDLSDPLVRNKAEQVTWVTIHRVCGEISVSRSIGDPDYKSFIPGAKVDAFFVWPDGHDQVFQADLLLPVPECRTISLLPGHDFLIIASDGLWDVVSGTEAVTRAKNALASGKNASEAAEELCDLALKLGSSDNVTAVIVQFIHS